VRVKRESSRRDIPANHFRVGDARKHKLTAHMRFDNSKGCRNKMIHSSLFYPDPAGFSEVERIC
jgi:hypothetical protein